MLEFIQLLKNRYINVLQTQKLDDVQRSIFHGHVETLHLAESFILKGELIESLPKHPLQIAIIGPTQSGKSSLTNLLLNNNAAGVSPLAGFTVHPHGFCNEVTEQECSWIYQYFEHFQRVKPTASTQGEYQCFSLAELKKPKPNCLPPCILWDTPDFDSIDAAGYQEGVLRTIALADIVVLVLSKEKYADQAVWDIMRLIAPLNQPTIIVLNKLMEKTKDILVNSLQEKWRQARNDSFPEVITLMYQTEKELHKWSESQQHQASRLFKAAQKKSNRRKHKDYQNQLLLSHWENWVEPVVAEHEALKDWRYVLNECIKEALEHYQRDYLNHPNHYETFHNALAELLTLLEIPGVAKLLVNTRKIITWPIRKIYQMAKSPVNLADSSHEVTILNQIGEHLLISISDRLLDKIDQQPEQMLWWKELNSLLRKQKNQTLQNYQAAVKTYHTEFQQEIETTAHRLYNKLQEQPMVLNSLRATRVTTDAAAVALALKTGGIGLHDLIITPAMLSITSLLAESAIGGYMSRVEIELKNTQLQTVKQRVFEQQIKTTLEALPNLMQQHTQFNIPEHQLIEMEQQLTEKRHGLRIF